MTLHEVAEELGVHYMTAYRSVRLGQLRAHKVGGVWQVEQSALDAPGREVDCDNPATATVFHDQVDGEILDVELGIVLQGLLVQGVQHRVAGAVRRGAGARRLLAAEVLALAAEGALVDPAVWQA